MRGSMFWKIVRPCRRDFRRRRASWGAAWTGGGLDEWRACLRCGVLVREGQAHDPDRTRYRRTPGRSSSEQQRFREAVGARAGWRCEAVIAGVRCTQTRGLQAHHVPPDVDTGSTAPSGGVLPARLPPALVNWIDGYLGERHDQDDLDTDPHGRGAGRHRPARHPAHGVLGHPIRPGRHRGRAGHRGCRRARRRVGRGGSVPHERCFVETSGRDAPAHAGAATRCSTR